MAWRHAIQRWSGKPGHCFAEDALRLLQHPGLAIRMPAANQRCASCGRAARNSSHSAAARGQSLAALAALAASTVAGNGASDVLAIRSDIKKPFSDPTTGQRRGSAGHLVFVLQWYAKAEASAARRVRRWGVPSRLTRESVRWRSITWRERQKPAVCGRLPAEQ